MKDRAYLTGLILIGLTFVVCVISFWLLLYGIFVFGIGVVFVFASKKSTKTKLVTTILPILLYVPITYLFLLAYNYSPPKTLLIPAGYEGQIRIIWEEKCGQKMRKENGRQILQFPANGILILNEKFDGGINNEYFLVDKNGKQTKVSEILDLKRGRKQPPYILVAGAGTIGSSTDDNAITFSDFYLYNKDTTETDDYKKLEIFDSLTNAVVNKCRLHK